MAQALGRFRKGHTYLANPIRNVSAGHRRQRYWLHGISPESGERIGDKGLKVTCWSSTNVQ